VDQHSGCGAGFLAGGGECGALMREHDWSNSPLGHPETWPQALKTLVGVALGSRQPMLIVWGKERTTLYNDGYAEMCGARHPRALGRPFDELWHEIWDQVEPILARAYAGESTHMNDIAFTMHRNGYPEETHFAFGYSPVRDDSGRVAGMFCACVETTKQFVAEQRLRESEDNYRHAVDLSPQTVWTARPDGQLDHVGPRWKEWTGTSGLGSSWGDAIHPDDLAPSVEAWSRSVATGEPYDIEHRARFRDGSFRWMHSRAYPRRDAGGAGGIKRWYGTTEDIHAARSAKEALRESEARFRNMADHAPVMMWVTDPSGYCSYLNRRWYEFTGQSVEKALGLGWIEATHPDDRNAAEEAFLSANAERRPFRLEYRLRRADGAYRWAIDAASPRFGEDGAFLGYVGSVIDIDDRKRAEARRLALADLSDRIRDLDDPADISFAAAEIMGRALGVSRAGYGTIDTAAETITIERDWNAPGIESLAGVLHFRDYGSYIEDLKRGETVVFADAERDPRTAATAEALKAISAQSVVNMPITEHGGLVALLYLNHATAREWTADELAFVREVAERTRVAVERRRAEQALRQSEAEARKLAAQQAATLGQLAEGVIVADAAGRITLVNDAAARLHGVRRLEVAPDDYSAAYSLLTEDGRPYPPLDLPLARAVRGETVLEARWRIRRPDGSEVLAVGNARPVLDAAGRQVGAVLTIRDDTARRAAEEEKERLNASLEEQVAERTAERDRVWRNSRDLLVVVGADGVFRAVNPAWTAILGHDPAEVVGRSFLQFVWPDDAEPTRGGLATASSARDLTDFQNRYRHKDGSPRWISWRTSAEGDLVYAYGRDITAEKEQAEALSQAEERLRQSQKMEAVGQLTGGIAHDFNNLLTGIIGSLELLGTRVAQGRIKDVERYVMAAQGASKRAAALTHRLLAFSRRQTLDPKPTDANRLVSGMEELIRRTVGPEVAVEVVAAGGLWTTLVDPNQLENALLNLCINARDAMPDGGRLTIETCNKWLDARAARERDLPPGQYVTLCVSDTGTGMTPEVARRAFDPFFTTKPIGMGTGLGLSMIYGFVRQSGGQARIYSEPGQGAMVCLYLPRHLGEAEKADGMAEPAEPPRSERGETVLVVDDEPTVRMLVAEVLGDLGYNALEAADGAAGLKLLRSETRIDLLVTDVGLPGGMNGRQVADAARTVRPGLKVLFITGYAENAVLSHGHLEPGMHVLTKPFAMEVLANRIKDLIAGG
jgi:PAS domain S-box-containing protein